ncbi:MAG: PASTA domain-containing protein [Acidimicrobiia bacterium]|nr:PASTA domain-containing protein [Acidimicrobiia bacterium]
MPCAMSDGHSSQRRRTTRTVTAVAATMLFAGVVLGACSGSDDESAFAGANETTSTASITSTTSTTVADSARAGGTPAVPAGGGNQGGASTGGGGGGSGGTPAPTSPDQYVVPDLVGQTRAAAEGLLSARGLRSLYVTVNDWRVARDIVSSQDQPPGQMLGPNGVVSFRVSSGPTMAPVPNVVGQCVSVARDRLLEAGFPSQVFYRVDAAKYYRVISSSPAASFMKRQGELVTLYVSTNATRDGCT